MTIIEHNFRVNQNMEVFNGLPVLEHEPSVISAGKRNFFRLATKEKLISRVLSAKKELIAKIRARKMKLIPKMRWRVNPFCVARSGLGQVNQFGIVTMKMESGIVRINE